MFEFIFSVYGVVVLAFVAGILIESGIRTMGFAQSNAGLWLARCYCVSGGLLLVQVGSGSMAVFMTEDPTPSAFFMSAISLVPFLVGFCVPPALRVISGTIADLGRAIEQNRERFQAAKAGRPDAREE